jgi:hypothetical protein
LAVLKADWRAGCLVERKAESLAAMKADSRVGCLDNLKADSMVEHLADVKADWTVRRYRKYF